LFQPHFSSAEMGLKQADLH